MGQPPNIEIELEDLPPEEPEPEPSHWTPGRPGEIMTPADAVWGGPFGHIGPDSGFARKLVAMTEYDRSEAPDLIDAVVANIAAARAAAVGRGPTRYDVETALVILGLRPDGLPTSVVERLAARRRDVLHHAAHERDKGAWLLEQISNELLVAPLAEIAALLSS
jgi:hypothetical protein